jgi:hypothetical protein
MMPGPYPLPTEEDIKETFFGCQRPDDQSTFIWDTKKLASAATREELINFMEILSNLRRSTGNNGTGNNSGNGHGRNKHVGGGDRYGDRDSDMDRECDDELSSDESDSSSESDDSHNDDRDFNQNKRNGNGNRSGGDRNGDDQAHKRSRDMDKCPFHPETNHTWSDCFGNPNGRNWKPQFAARVADVLAKAKSGSNNNNKQGGDTNAHIHDDGTPSYDSDMY